MAGEAGQQVIQLRKLHLEAAFAGSRARGKDVQNELGAVDDLGVYQLLEVALLGGREVVVEDHHVGAAESDGGRDLFHFATANEGGGVRSRTRLIHFFDNPGSRAGGQFGQFLEGFFRRNGFTAAAGAARFPLQPDQNRPLSNGVTEWRVSSLRRILVGRCPRGDSARSALRSE